jgi:hypothetical protein
LRKKALIATGWHREAIIEAGNAKAALRVAAYARGRDEFAHVITRGPTVIVRWARSQRMHGQDRMDKAEFQQSKDDILGWIANLLGVDPERLALRCDSRSACAQAVGRRHANWRPPRWRARKEHRE